MSYAPIDRDCDCNSKIIAIAVTLCEQGFSKNGQLFIFTNLGLFESTLTHAFRYTTNVQN